MARERRLPLPKAGIDARGTKWSIKYDRDWQEWQVRAYTRSRKTGAWKFREGPTYHSEDRDDAIQTFHHIVGYGPGYTRANPKRGRRLAKSRARIRARVKRVWRQVGRHLRWGTEYPAFGKRSMKTLKLSGRTKARKTLVARIGKKLYKATVR